MRTGEPVRVTHLSRWANFSDWLKPMIKASAFEGITRFKQFLIARNGSGETVIQVREHCAMKGCRFDRGIREGTAVTKPWKGDQPKLHLRGMKPAQRRELVRQKEPRVESGSSSSESDAESENAGSMSSRDQEIAFEKLARTKKVHKVRSGCEKLVKAKGTGLADKTFLYADLELLCGVGELPLDLPHGLRALEHLLCNDFIAVSGDLVDSRFELDSVEDGRIKMKSGYAIELGMHVAVLVDEHAKDIHTKWNYGKVKAIFLKSPPVIRIEWVVRTNAKKKAFYRPSQQEDDIEADTIQCQVEFTKYTKATGFALTKACIREKLMFFLEQADIQRGRDGKSDGDDGDEGEYGDSC